MKKIIVLVLMFLTLPCFAQEQVEQKPLEATITFDWISKTQLQRDENIKEIQNIIFNGNFVKYSRKEFEKKYSVYWKNENYLHDYDEINQGKKEDADKYYCGFYVGKLLIAYGVQSKKNMKNIYYYDAMGGLRWIDVFSDNYPDFPYWSYQYYRDGKLVAAYYYVSDYDQYVFDANKKFKGRWYKDKMYNKNAKVIMTRTNY
ncbi:MAG: hypothetical protein PHC64_00615 [Candidatus Gastranaerophilales bacterium]|nr:hypothetical protein [Candidatus Gastranaerophilales bacterium]